MDLEERLIVWCLALLDRVLDLLSFGVWSDVRGKEKPKVRVKQ